MLGDGILEQRFEQGGTFRIGDTPANHSAAEDVDDHVEVEVGPFFRADQLRYIPGPDLAWTFGDRFWLLVDGMAQLSASLLEFVMFMQNPIHGAN